MEYKHTYETFSAFKPHFDALARVGFYKIVYKTSSSTKLVLHKLYCMFTWVIVVIYNLQHIVRVIQVRHSTEQIVDVLFILLTTLNVLSKKIAFNMRSRRIDHIIDVMNGSVFSAKNNYHTMIMKENAVMMHRLLKFYITCIFICGTLWTIFPLVNKAMGVDVEFTGYVPFDTRSSPGFELALAYFSVLITFQAYGNVSMDCTIVAMYAQTKVQLQMLRHDLENLLDLRDDGLSEEIIRNVNRVTFKDLENPLLKKQIQKRIIDGILHMKQIIWFVKEVEAIFAEAMCIQFLITAWVICMTVYKIVGLSVISVEFLSMAMYLGCMLAQLFIYCYYGSQVTFESKLLSLSVYCSDWMSLSPSLRQQILLMMVSCIRPIILRTANVIPISLETYIAVLRASYTLFTFLDKKQSIY